jgi:hypothetical protein
MNNNNINTNNIDIYSVNIHDILQGIPVTALTNDERNHLLHIYDSINDDINNGNGGGNRLIALENFYKNLIHQSFIQQIIRADTFDYIKLIKISYKYIVFGIYIHMVGVMYPGASTNKIHSKLLKTIRKYVLNIIMNEFFLVLSHDIYIDHNPISLNNLIIHNDTNTKNRNGNHTKKRNNNNTGGKNRNNTKYIKPFDGIIDCLYGLGMTPLDVDVYYRYYREHFRRLHPDLTRVYNYIYNKIWNKRKHAVILSSFIY